MQFSKKAIFLKPHVMLIFWHEIVIHVLRQNRPFFNNFFGENIFKNHNICRLLAGVLYLISVVGRRRQGPAQRVGPVVNGVAALEAEARGCGRPPAGQRRVRTASEILQPIL
jgi:hypothetical protein